MMKRFASTIDPNGPAMTEAIYATIWARLSDPERAYTEWRQAWTDFTAATAAVASFQRSAKAGSRTS